MLEMLSLKSALASCTWQVCNHISGAHQLGIHSK